LEKYTTPNFLFRDTADSPLMLTYTPPSHYVALEPMDPMGKVSVDFKCRNSASSSQEQRNNLAEAAWISLRFDIQTAKRQGRARPDEVAGDDKDFEIETY